MSKASIYELQYSPPDESILYHHSDKNLTPIRLSLPKPPPLHLIDGYGLPAKDQRFKRLEIPNKIRRLEKIAIESMEEYRAKNKNFVPTKFKVQKEFWSRLEAKQEYYQDEIDWIKKVWWHRLNGYWFFNHGKPTYISGWHFMYLNFWYMPDVRPDGYPHYRDRDRKEFVFHLYAYTTTETFARLGNDGHAISEKDGTYKMISLGRRTCIGVGQPKHRRSGNTNKGLCIEHTVVSETIGTDGGGIMSYTGDNAEAHFSTKLILAWNKMPLCLVPYTTSSSSPSSVEYRTPNNEFGLSSLNTAITYASTSSSTFYDGKKLIVAMLDESGKTTSVSVDDRWNVIRNCLTQGNGMIIHGYSYHPSTVEEYTSGGEAYRRMMNRSCFYQRVKVSGQTPSGIFRLFLPADEGLDGYIDSYGMSVKGEVLDYQKEEGFIQTATEYLDSIKEYHKSLDTPEALSAYRSELKQFPTEWSHCWLGEAGDIGFNLEKIDRRISELNAQSESIRGDFVWKGEIFGAEVEWRPSEEGRFVVSNLFEHRSNKRVKDVAWDHIEQEEKVVWAPMFPNFGTAGADPFKFKKKSEIKKHYSSQSMSDGGFSIVWHYDSKIDGDHPRSEWKSEDIICTYRYRASTDDEYCEDILKACIWYGVLCYPEMNITTVYKKFREWGYAGYLKYEVTDDGVMKSEPGVTIGGANKQAGFSLMRDYIEYRCHKIKHLELLMEMKNIQNVDDLTNYDLLASFMCALLGYNSRYSKIIENFNESKVDVHGLVRMFKY